MPSLYGTTSSYTVYSTSTPTLYVGNTGTVITATTQATNLPGLYSNSYAPLPSNAQALLNLITNDGTVWFGLDAATGNSTIHAFTTGTALTNIGDYVFNKNAITLNDGLNSTLAVGSQNWAFNLDGTTQFPAYRFPAANGLITQVLSADGGGNLYWATATIYSTSTVDIFSGNSVQTAFTLSRTPLGLNSLEVVVGGVTQTPTLSYTLAGNVLTFNEAPPTQANNILVNYAIQANANYIPGYVGSQGYNGSRGYTGSTGFTGSIGFTGSTGTQGLLGYTGSRGYTGSTGFIGSQGIQGPAGGYTGSRGYTGSTGLTGYVGYNGSRGFTGSTGTQGYTGSLGFYGSVGFTGSKGDPGGYTGSTGFIGSQGIQGPAGGYTGSRGYIGSIGPQGPAGYTGSGGNAFSDQALYTTSSVTFANLTVTNTGTFGGGNVTINNNGISVGPDAALYADFIEILAPTSSTNYIGLVVTGQIETYGIFPAPPGGYIAGYQSNLGTTSSYWANGYISTLTVNHLVFASTGSGGIAISQNYKTGSIFTPALDINNQGAGAIAIGIIPGQINQGINSIAIGYAAANSNQGTESVAIGVSAGQTVQGRDAVAIGWQAGATRQGDYSIAIGYKAGVTSQTTGSIIISAGSSTFVSSATNAGLYISPVRHVTTSTLPSGFYNMAYNPTTYEIIYWT
jgi:hypothetical protein